MRAAADGVVRRLTDQPFSSGELIQSVTASVRVDAALEPFAAAEGLRRSYGNGFTAYSLPVYGDNVDGNSVLRLGDGAEAILEFFRGNTPPPPTE